MSGVGRLLLIDYHFGSPGATGGFRWRSMAAYLSGEGWRFDVITRLGDGAGEPGGQLGREGVRLFGVAAPTTADSAIAALSRLRRRLGGRSNTAARSAAAPDGGPVVWAPPRVGPYARLARVVEGVRITAAEWGWARRAARFGRELARRERYRGVVVSSPPHLAQLAGAAVGRAAGIPYVADFRDPWVFGRPEKYDVNPLANRLGRWYEGPTLCRAVLVLCNTEHARRAVATIYPELAARAVAIPNGYDTDGTTPLAVDARCFRVVYTGWLYPFMEPECVLAAVGRLRHRAGLGPDELVVEFQGCAGAHRGVPLAVLAARHGLEDRFRLLPRGSREEAQRLQAAAAVRVAFDASTQLAMPMKFFDYAQAGGTMLLVGFPDGALAAAAAALGLQVYAPEDAAGLDAVLDEALRRWRRGDLVAPLDRDGLFDRRRHSRRVHELLLSLPTSA